MNKNNSEHLQTLKERKKEMNHYLYHHVEDSKTRDKLLDQLKWLTHEITHFEENSNLELLIDEFNWVISNFNQELDLAKDGKFSFLSEKKL